MGEFFGKLFDMSFDEFITPTVMKVLYIIAIALSALWALGLLAALADSGGAEFVVGLILAPTMFVLSILLARIILESMLVLFSIAESTRNMASAMERDTEGDSRE